MSAVIVPHLQRLAPRERLFLAGGGLALLLVIPLVASPSSGAGEKVELAQPAAAPPAYFPPPKPVVTPPAPAAAAPASTAGLTLRSVLATGAIFAFQGGGERLVPIGREFQPGLTLKEVGLSHATASSKGGDVRFELGRAGGAAAAVLSGSAAAFPAATVAGADKAGARDTMAYRLGLEPEKANGRIAGYALRPGADLPALRQAGLQSGDVIVAVNGSGFDEERLMELAWSIANSSRTEFEFLRNGRRMKGAIGSPR